MEKKKKKKKRFIFPSKEIMAVITRPHFVSFVFV